MDQQLRVTDLIPIRIRAFVLLFFLGLAAIAALEWLYAWMPRVAAHTTDGRVAAFDLDGEGSLGAWFSSLLLGLAGLVSLLVYSLRRRRIDDYRGRYRIWLLAALCWFTMSIDESGSLHEGFKEFMVYLTGNRLWGDGSIWWVLAYGGVLGYVGLRLVFDMRECVSSTLAMFMTAACFSVAIAAQLGWLLPDFGARAVMVEEGGEMLGDLFLLLAMTLHARYMIRDIQGLVTHKEKTATKAKPRKTNRKPAREAEASAAAKPAKKQAPKKSAPTTKQPSPTKQPSATKPTATKAAAEKPAKPAPTKTAPAAQSRIDEPEPVASNKPKMTKAERKAERRKRRLEGRET